jgi:4-amino-4-deoxy-L-arabinose transferase-like glycosyltransferase
MPFSARLRWRSDWICFGGICLFALCLRFPIAAIPLERDEGEYAYIAQRWLQGDLPYRDSFDQKPPGVHVMYVLIESLCGTTPAAIHWGAQIYTLGTLAVLFLLGRRLASPAAGLAAAAFAAFMTTDPSVLGNAANTEVFMLLPLTAAMLASWYAVERASLAWAFGAGAFAAAAVLFKQVALSNLVFHLLVVTWLSRRRVAGATLLLLGTLCVLLPVCAYFAIHGAWDDFFDATVGHNLRYATRLRLALYPQAFWTYFKPCLRSFWPIVLLAAAQIGRRVLRVGCWVRDSHAESQPPTPALRDPSSLVLAWLGASFLGTASGGFFRPHYFIQSIPPVALLAGMAVGSMELRRLGASLRFAIRAAPVATAIAIGMLAYGWYYQPGDVEAKTRRLYGTNAVLESPAVGRFIAAHSGVHDSVFILGSEPQILYYAERKSASRYIFVYPLTGPFPDVRERQHAALREITDAAPRFIVTVSEPYSFLADPNAPTDLTDALAALVKQSYQLAAVVPLMPEGAAPLVTGERATEVWRSAPFSCCSLVVWERTAALRSSS